MLNISEILHTIQVDRVPLPFRVYCCWESSGDDVYTRVFTSVRTRDRLYREISVTRVIATIENILSIFRRLFRRMFR